jgi:hypothetical protein
MPLDGDTRLCPQLSIFDTNRDKYERLSTKMLKTKENRDQISCMDIYLNII